VFGLGGRLTLRLLHFSEAVAMVASLAAIMGHSAVSLTWSTISWAMAATRGNGSCARLQMPSHSLVKIDWKGMLLVPPAAPEAPLPPELPDPLFERPKVLPDELAPELVETPPMLDMELELAPLRMVT